MKKKMVLFVVFCSFSIVFPDFSEGLMTCSGSLNFEKNQYEMNCLKNDKPLIKAEIKEIGKNKFHVFSDIQHLNLFDYDVSTKADGVLNVIDSSHLPAQLNLSMKLLSEFLLINYQPIGELKIDFEVHQGKFNIVQFQIGKVSAEGILELDPPHELDLRFNIHNVTMNNFLKFWIDELEFESGGQVNGVIEVSGDFENLYLKGVLQSWDGFFDDEEFDHIRLYAEGQYPLLKIEDSVVAKKDGMISRFNGDFDLRDKENYQKQINAIKFSPIVTDSGNEIEWTLKSLDDESSGKTEVKYFLRKKDSFNGDEEVASDMLGVERKVEF